MEVFVREFMETGANVLKDTEEDTAKNVRLTLYYNYTNFKNVSF